MNQGYEVKYKLPNMWFWRKLKNIVEDGIIEENKCRWFSTKHRERIEIPLTCEFYFSEERQDIIDNRHKEELDALPGIKIP